MKIKLKKYTKINNAKRKSSYIESKLCKMLQLKQIFCCETRVRGKLVASPSPSYRQYIHQIAGFCSITSLVAYNT